MEESTKLTVHDLGDGSVGLYPVSWEVECPFNKEDIGPRELEYFRSKIQHLYREYATGRITSEYDFEYEDRCVIAHTLETEGGINGLR